MSTHIIELLNTKMEHIKQNPELGIELLIKAGILNRDGTHTPPYSDGYEKICSRSWTEREGYKCQ